MDGIFRLSPRDRNHRCRTIEELLDQVFDWLDHQPGFAQTVRATYAKAA